MIERHGNRVAYLGGALGDELWVSDEAGPFRLLARLGTNPETQTTPQRRMCLTDDAVFVLEPCMGPLIDPPFRVRRFALADGGETVTAEGPGKESPDGDLYWRADRAGQDAMRILRCGVDGHTGEALTHTVEIPRGKHLPQRESRSGIPLRLGNAVWLSIRQEGLLRLEGDSHDRFPGDPGRAVGLDGHCVTPGHESRDPGAAGGIFVDGAFQELDEKRLFPLWYVPLGPMVVEGPVVLALDGRIVGPSAVPALPRGRYIGLLRLGGAVCALEESAEPKWVPISAPSSL